MPTRAAVEKNAAEIDIIRAQVTENSGNIAENRVQMGKNAANISNNKAEFARSMRNVDYSIRGLDEVCRNVGQHSVGFVHANNAVRGIRNVAASNERTISSNQEVSRGSSRVATVNIAIIWSVFIVLFAIIGWHIPDSARVCFALAVLCAIAFFAFASGHGILRNSN